jgi:chromosome segregation ATPase
MKQWIGLCVLTLAFLTSAILALSTSASADDIAQLGAAVTADKLEMSKLQTDMDTEVAENGTYKKEFDVYDDQVKTRLTPLIEAYNTRLNAHNDRATKVNAAVDRHNAGCHGTQPQPVFARCKGEEPPLQRMIDDINTRKAALDAEKANLAGQQTQYKTAMDGLADKMNANRAAWDKNKARFDELQAKIETAQAGLADQCKNTPLDQRNVPQYLKYCASSGFDNPDANLKPLDEDAAPKGMRITPN